VRIPRIYHPIKLLPGEKATLTQEATQHVKHVLRLKPGSELCIFSGDGGESPSRIIEAQREVIIEAFAYREYSLESPRHIHLWQGLCRGERMDWVIQKATELGVSGITPVMTERSVVKLDAERTQKRQQHWEKVIVSACEQCGRNRLPKIHAPVSLHDIPVQEGICLLLDPMGTVTLKDIPLPAAEATIHLFVGPEGGISDLEISSLHLKKFTSVQMGPRILRVETAALTAVALIQARWGDL